MLILVLNVCRIPQVYKIYIIVGSRELSYRKSTSVYVRQTDGKEKLYFWEAGLPRKGICIAYNESKLYLIKHSKIIFEIDSQGERIEGEPSYYELQRSIRGYYILTHHYIGRTIRPGRDDDYYPSYSHKVFDENGNIIENWNGEDVGINKYPVELGLGLVVLENVVYELDSLLPIFKIPEKYKINGLFSKDGILKLDVVGDYRNFYVQILEGRIVSQHREEDLNVLIETLRGKQLDFLKMQNPILYGNLPSIEAATSYLNEIGHYMQYENSIATNYLYSKPCLCEISWIELEQFTRIPSNVIKTITKIHESLFSVNLSEPSRTSYVFKFSQHVYCRIFRDFILLFKSLSVIQDDVLLFTIAGQKLSHENRYQKGCLHEGNLPFSTNSLILYDANGEKFVKVSIEGDKFESVVDYTFNHSFRHGGWTMDDTTIRPECFSGNIISNRCMDFERALIFSQEELKKFYEISSFHKDAKYLFRITYGVFCKLFKDYFIVVNKISEDKRDDNWRLWIYRYDDSRPLNDEYYIINGAYLTRAIINYTNNRFVVYDKKKCVKGVLAIEKYTLVFEDESNLPQDVSIIESAYVRVNVVEKIKDYLFSLDINILDIDDYGKGFMRDGTKNYYIMDHLTGKQSLSIDGVDFKIDPIKRNACLDEIYYRHKNRPNYVSSVQFVNKFLTKEGLVEIYKFQCNPYAFCDTEGNIYYDFSIDDVVL